MQVFMLTAGPLCQQSPLLGNYESNFLRKFLKEKKGAKIGTMINIIKLLSTQKHGYCFAQLRSKYGVNFTSTSNAKAHKKRQPLLCGLAYLIMTRGLTYHRTACDPLYTGPFVDQFCKTPREKEE